MSSALVERAMSLALRAHEGQYRKDAPTPYITHPVRVALILARQGFDDELLAAALVHDVVEDTNITIEELRHELGEEVAALVEPLTHNAALPWKEKKEEYIRSVRFSNDRVKAIVTADKIANAESLLDALARDGNSAWDRFSVSREQKLWFEDAVLSMLRETWTHPLVDSYAELVDRLNHSF